MLTETSILWTAWEGENIVGIARSLTDYGHVCYLADLTVIKKYQHQDVDIDFDAQHTQTVIQKLKEIGYITEVDWMPARMELKHERLGYLDIHPINFNDDGTITQADPVEEVGIHFVLNGLL